MIFKELLILVLIFSIACSKTGSIKEIDPKVAYGDIRNGFASIIEIKSSESYDDKLNSIKNRLIIRCDTNERCAEHAKTIATLGIDVEISGTIKDWTDSGIILE